MPALRDGPSISQVAIQILGKREPRAPSTLGNDGNSEAIDYLLLRDLAPINVFRLSQTREPNWSGRIRILLSSFKRFSRVNFTFPELPREHANCRTGCAVDSH